ncbi:hypothetical protein BD410DRAFT_780479 [Rickenella mellea]|uniref:Uncharacterized protein n=1 Tax=Rickenella mellea TaxID=50990 RepID=A0A4R5XH52_9AGAM|nr:hypothetical protein BD410DRAFT_780479 [Rickenella mellea]
MSKLPDEILKEILAPPLRIPDDEFSFTGRARESPFGRKARNSSSLLVVSKQWMRVATPLLYEVVIMRSTAQAQALAYAINSNKAFGLFIKKLRMEGGFGKAPAQFIASAPNIRELFVTLDVWSNDGTSGLCSVLSDMNIRRLIINHQDPAIKNAQSTRLWQSLSSCIPRWSNLRILEYHTTYMMAKSGKDKYVDLVTVLQASPSIKHVVLDSVPRRDLCELTAITSLETVSVESIESIRSGMFYSVPLSKIVQVRTEVQDEPTPVVLPFASVVGSFKPLENVPTHTAKPIWDLICSFAVHSYYVEKLPSVKSHNAPDLSPSRSPFYRTARSLCLVSKYFRDITRRHLFSIVQVETNPRFSLFCRAMNDSDTLVHLVRVLRVNCLRELLGGDYNNHMTQLLPKLTALVYVDVPLLDLGQLELLNPAVSTNLQTLDVRLAVHTQSDTDPVDLGVLYGVVYLRCRVDPSVPFRSPTWRLPGLAVDLPNLTRFSMGVNEKEDTLDAFYSIKMPSLTHLQLCGRHPKTPEFLRLNGQTLKVLEIFDTPTSALWTWCPCLEDLIVYYDPTSVFKPLPGGQRHSSLSKLSFSLRVPRSNNVEKAMLLATDGFEFVDFSQFPNFREVHIRGLTWPNTERDIKKNPTCDSFALCLKKWGIAVYDGSGTRWRERAQIRHGR